MQPLARGVSIKDREFVGGALSSENDPELRCVGWIGLLDLSHGVIVGTIYTLSGYENGKRQRDVVCVADLDEMGL